MRKKTKPEFINTCIDVGLEGFKFDGEVMFTKTTEHAGMECIKCGHFTLRLANHFQAGKVKCPICSGGQAIGHDEWMLRFQYIFPERYVLYDWTDFIFKNKRTKSPLRCINCGRRWDASPDKLMGGHGCSGCVGGVRLTLDEVIISFREEHGIKYGYSKFIYTNGHTLGIIICPFHGEFKQSAHNHKSGQGCPYCNESHGARDTSKWLANSGFRFEREHSYADLVGMSGYRVLLFDFYLPDYNILIEYDGIQHFEKLGHIPQWKYDRTIEHDKRKSEYCDKHNIRLIRIRYDESIDVVLTRYLLDF